MILLVLTALAGLVTLAILGRRAPESQSPAPPQVTHERLLTTEDIAQLLGLPSDRFTPFATLSALPPVRIGRSPRFLAEQNCREPGAQLASRPGRARPTLVYERT